MRAAFANTLTELSEQDSRLLLLTADLGFMALEPFSNRFPDRFFNVGVAEQNMVGLATGLAEAGFIPFVYSIVTFASLRPYEFIRNGPVLHHLPVRIIGMGGGVEYGTAGPTHHGVEDVGVLRLQPGLQVICPADFQQARSALLATWNLPGPIYYRLGKDDKTIVPGLNGAFDLERAQVIRQGQDFLFISLGNITAEVAQAVETLAARGINCTLLVVSSMNPGPLAHLTSFLRQFRVVATVEAHYTVGGLGSLVSELVAEEGLNCRVIRCGIKNNLERALGSQSFIYKQNDLSKEALVNVALNALAEVG